MRPYTIIFLSAIAALFGCGESICARYDAGYSDGYAEGYNTTLRIRATMVSGDWNDKEYTRGYNDGRIQGVSEALAKKDR
jgi:hypothetical protein